MRRFGVVAAAAVILMPGICAADDVSRNQVDAAPYIAASLTAPMPGLSDQALKKAPKDALRLGLAMLAGRANAVSANDADDAAKLKALELRIEPVIGAYLKAHPGTDAGRTNWITVTQETPDEAAFVEHYLQVHSADYWLENAIYALDARETFVPRRPDLNVQLNGDAKMTDSLQMEKAIDTNIVLAAAQCVVAVRREAGIDYRAWSTLPLAIRLLQTLPRQDMQARVDGDLANKAAHLKYPVGAAACGTDDQFKTDVAALKAAP